MKIDFRTELNNCLAEQGFDWHSELDFTALALLGLLDFHKEDIEKIMKEEAKKKDD